MGMAALEFNDFCTSNWMTVGQKLSSPYKLAADREYRHAVHRVEISTASDPWRTVAALPRVAVVQRKRSSRCVVQWAVNSPDEFEESEQDADQI